MANKIKEHSQLSNLGKMVILYELDMNPIGTNIVLRFCNSVHHKKPVRFNGTQYFPIAVEATGFEYDGRSAFPNPEITIANVDGYLNQYMNKFEDFIGAGFTRIRTFDKFLDTGEDPNPAARFPDDKFTVEQKQNHNKVFIKYRLAASIDQEGRKVPGRLALKNSCTWRYRIWDANAVNPDGTTGAFNYKDVQCPYTGNRYYDKNNEQVFDKAKDQCSKTLTGCRKRFPGEPLPLSFFPGLNAFRKLNL